MGVPLDNGLGTPSGPASERELVLRLTKAYSPRLTPAQFFSHVTAARLHGIPIPLRLLTNQLLDVSVAAPSRAVRARGVRGHKHAVRREEVVRVEGLPVSSPIRVWLELAPLLTVEELISAGDYLLWWRRPLATADLLQASVHASIGRRGLARLTEALPLLSERSDSPPESAIRYRIARAGLPMPVVNENLYDSEGRFLAKPDLAFPEYFMAIDYEGDHHRTDIVQWRKDLARVPRLEDAGWHSTRVSAEDLRDSREFLARLSRRLVARGWTG
ncbi:MAG: hypothetical protein JWM49_2955 [Microbacteriaceae bacterium]|nr:hypothetical protein [Microbacteriaceae bacterium]